MRRAVAIVAAVLLVVGAIVIRSRLDDNEVARTVRLTCATELEAVCRELAGRLQTTVEPAGTTADRLATAAGDSGLDGWLVLDPWPQIVDERRQRRSLPALFGERTPVARTPLVMVVWNERAAALGGRCRGPVNWKCLGEAVQAGEWRASGGRPEWGPIKPGHPSPASDGLGLLVLGHAVAGWFGGSDLSTQNLDDDAFSGWFTALEKAVTRAGASCEALARMLTFGEPACDAVGTTEAEAQSLLASASRRNDLTLLYPAPMASADVVLATAGSGSAASSVRRLAGGGDARRVLTDSGWKAASSGASGLPSPGLLDALLTRWKDIR